MKRIEDIPRQLKAIFNKRRGQLVYAFGEFKNEMSNKATALKSWAIGAFCGVETGGAAVLAAGASAQYLNLFGVLALVLGVAEIGRRVSDSVMTKTDAPYSARLGFITFVFATVTAAQSFAENAPDEFESFIVKYTGPEAMAEYYNNLCDIRKFIADYTLHPDYHFECEP